MGCAFSCNGVRVPRIFKRKKVYRSRKYLNSKLPVVSPDVTTVRASEHSHSVEMKQSERPATLNNNSQTAGWYSSDVAPSTLLFLAGPKDCVEDSIPEIMNVNAPQNTNGNENKGKEFILPACLQYEGYHEYGFHLFTLNSSMFNSTVQDMSLNCVPDAIASILREEDKPFVLVYKNSNNQTTYLPDPPAWGKDLLDRICTRFAHQLLRVLLYQPSWFLQIVLEEQKDNSCYFSSAVVEKLRVTSDFKELARLTGFPGEIKRKSP